MIGLGDPPATDGGIGDVVEQEAVVEQLGQSLGRECDPDRNGDPGVGPPQFLEQQVRDLRCLGRFEAGEHLGSDPQLGELDQYLPVGRVRGDGLLGAHPVELAARRPDHVTGQAPHAVVERLLQCVERQLEARGCELLVQLAGRCAHGRGLRFGGQRRQSSRRIGPARW